MSRPIRRSRLLSARPWPILLALATSVAHADLPTLPSSDEGAGGPLREMHIRNLPGNVGEQITSADRDLLEVPALDLWIGVAGKFRSFGVADETLRAIVRPDYSLQLDADRPLGPFFVIATLGRRWGPPPTETGMRNTWFAFGGLAYRPDGDTEIGALTDYRQSVWTGDPPLREVSAYATRWVAADVRVRAYVYRTVLEPRGEWGGGFSAALWF